MNDCVFSFACEEPCNCKGCEDYLSMNFEQGEKIQEEYWERVREACAPVREWLLSHKGRDAE